MNSSHNQEEIDLGQLFKYFESLIIKLKNFIVKILRLVFYALLMLFLYVRKHTLKFSIVVIIGAAIGFTIDKIKDKEYYSYMMVQPNYGSIYQLYSNIEYYNGLIDEKDFKQLSAIFKISETEAKALIEFNIEAGPNNENENLLLYDNFIKTADSLTVALTSYEDFVKEQNVYNRSKYIIQVNSKDRFIFKKIENSIVNGVGFNDYLTNQLNNELKAFDNKELDLLTMVNRLDSINNLYQEVLLTEASNKQSVSTNIDLAGESSNKTKELELLDKKNNYLNEIRALQHEKLNKNTFLNVLSSFQSVGIKDKSFLKKKTLQIPILLFVLLFIYIIFRDFNTYLKRVELNSSNKSFKLKANF